MCVLYKIFIFLPCLLGKKLKEFRTGPVDFYSNTGVFSPFILKYEAKKKAKVNQEQNKFLQKLSDLENCHIFFIFWYKFASFVDLFIRFFSIFNILLHCTHVNVFFFSFNLMVALNKRLPSKCRHKKKNDLNNIFFWVAIVVATGD